MPSTPHALPDNQRPHAIWRGVHQTLAKDTTGGALLLGATILALIFANSRLAGFYEDVREFSFGPEALHLNLSIAAWAADGLLAVFFFVVGLELKEEFVAGKLRDPRTALVPIVAAIGGVAVPALIFTAINLNAGGDALNGWAIPAATDIAFAVAVIAVVGRFLPPALRTFLLTLAVVDDLLAISIIAIFYTDGIAFVPLLAALLPLAVFAVLVQRGVRSWWVLIPLGVAVWTLIHASGIHATVAGVLLGFMVPVVAKGRAKVRVGTKDDGSPLYEGMAAHFADKWSVFSSAFAVPVFAFFSAGVTVGGISGLLDSLGSSIALGIIGGLVLGKAIGITAGTFLVTRLRGIVIDKSLAWIDIIGMSFIAGIGFTVSLLVGELSYDAASDAAGDMKVGVIVGSVISATIGAVILTARNRRYRAAAASMHAEADEPRRD